MSEQNEDTIEKAIITAVTAFAIVAALGIAAHQRGMLDGAGKGTSPFKASKPVIEAVYALAGDAAPQRVLLFGTVGDQKAIDALVKGAKRTFPDAEHMSSLRADIRARERDREVVRISLAADAPNERWPRPRFGDVKRLELLWREDKVTLRGAVFTAEANAKLKAAFNSVSDKHRGAYQLKEVVRANVSASATQDAIITALNGRAITFGPDATIAAAVTEAAAILDALAPPLKDLTGLEVIISAGDVHPSTALRQAEAVRDALVARGADVTGLRPVQAAKNNLLSLIVREKE